MCSFTAEEAEKLGSAGEAVILVREETSPEDIRGMDAARGIVTARGGMTSHAAVVARGMGRPCVSGAGEIHIDLKAREFRARGKAIKAYEKAIKMRDDMPVLYSNLGYAYFGDKRYEESIAAFRIALSKDPQFFEHNSSRNGSLLQDRSVSDRGRFYFLLAKSFAESGNQERAILYLRKAKDEGFATLIADVKKDKAFAALLKNEEVQNLIAPKPAETEQP